MNTKSLKAGIIALVTIVAFFVLINFLKGKNIFKGGKTLYVVYSNVSGLLPTKPVTINGMKVGTVDDISFTKDGSGKILVTLNIKSDLEFDANTKAVIYSPGLVSGTEIKLEMSRKGKVIEEGQYLKGEIETSMMESLSNEMNPVKQKIEAVLVSLDSTLLTVRGLNNTKNKQAIAGLFSNLNGTINSYNTLATTAVSSLKGVDQLSLHTSGLVAENRKVLAATVSNMNETLINFKNISKQFHDAHIENSIKKLENSLANLETLTNEINNGKGNMGKLLKDEQLYTNLENASKEMELLMRDLKEHPKRYVHFSIFGKKDKGYVPTVVDSVQ